MGATMLAATFWGLTGIDLTVITLYFLSIFYITYRVIKRIHNQEDYFLAGRNFGKGIQTFAAFGQATSVENMTMTTTMVNANGAAGIWAALASGVVNMPIFWMTSVWYRRLRLLTLADFFKERYRSRRMASFYAGCQAIFFVFIAAIGLTAMGKTVAAIAAKPVEALSVTEKAEYDQALEKEKLDASDFALLTEAQQHRLGDLRMLNPKKEFSFINEDALIMIVALVTLIYTSAGGLMAAFITDLIQGVFILILTVLLIPFAMMKINAMHGTSGFMGTFHTIHRVLPASFLELWGSPSLMEFTWYWIVVFSIMGMVNVAVQANQLTACASAKDEYTARYGFVSGIFLKRYSNVIWGFVALMTLVLYAGSVSDPDYVWGHATRDLLGPVGIGLVGLMVASLMAALMAAKSAMMLTTSALLTHNLYRPAVPNKSENHYVWVGRIIGVLYMAASAWLALKYRDIFGLLKILTMFNCIVAASFWLGMVWRRANRIGAWTSMIVTFISTLLLPMGLPMLPGITSHPYLLATTNPIPVSRTYTAREMDVEERRRAVERWDQLSAVGKAQGQRPRELKANELFEKTYQLPKKSIYWSDGLKMKEGKLEGVGMLKVELVAINRLGWDLSKNSYALNETIMMLFRLILPVVTLMGVSLLNKPEEDSCLDQFYGKMRTPVRGSHEDDARAMELTCANPRRFNHLKLFPRSSWEFRKWEREDWAGVLAASVGAAGVVLLLWGIVRLGG